MCCWRWEPVAVERISDNFTPPLKNNDFFENIPKSVIKQLNGINQSPTTITTTTKESTETTHTTATARASVVNTTNNKGDNRGHPKKPHKQQGLRLGRTKVCQGPWMTGGSVPVSQRTSLTSHHNRHQRSTHSHPQHKHRLKKGHWQTDHKTDPRLLE